MHFRCPTHIILIPPSTPSMPKKNGKLKKNLNRCNSKHLSNRTRGFALRSNDSNGKMFRNCSICSQSIGYRLATTEHNAARCWACRSTTQTGRVSRISSARTSCT